MRSFSYIPIISRKGILLFWVLYSGLAAMAQPGLNFIFRGLQQGLSHQVVSCIYQYHQGFM